MAVRVKYDYESQLEPAVAAEIEMTRVDDDESVRCGERCVE